MTEEKDINHDDRDHATYGLPNSNKIQFNQSMVWVPVGIGLSVAAGVYTTRILQRLTQGTSFSNLSKATKQATSFSSSSANSFLPESARTPLTAKTFYGKLPYGGDFGDPMVISEAAKILGCRETSSKEMITKRFKTLMKNNHPDLGGCKFIAAKVNEAKTVLMKGK